MSLLLSRLSRLGKPASVRSSLVNILSHGFSSSLLQTPPCSIICIEPCGADLGKLVISNANECECIELEKKVPLELVDKNAMVTIGASHGWVATLKKEDGILRLQDDLNPNASYTNPKRIPLPPLVTLPRCQTQMVTNVAMSSPSPEDEDCVVAVKFLGPQLSFCRPAQSNTEWTNIRIANPSFFSSRVVYSKKDEMFRIPGSGGHLIGSWDPRATKDHKPKIQRLRFKNLPKLAKAKAELLDSCYRSEHLVESRTTVETFLVKWYKKATTSDVKMITKAVMVFNIDDKGNTVYTQDIGDLCMFLSKSEPFCVPASSCSGLHPNDINIIDVDETACFFLDKSFVISKTAMFPAPYFIPSPNID